MEVKYRSRSEIIELLLNAAVAGGATKTKLMYSAFISFNQLKEYLSLLAEKGLIQYEEGTHTLRTTMSRNMMSLHRNLHERPRTVIVL